MMIGLGKPKKPPGADMMSEDDGYEEPDEGAKELAGSELKSALESGDGTAICEAVKRIMEI